MKFKNLTLFIIICWADQLLCSQLPSSSNLPEEQEPFHRWIKNAPLAPYTGAKIPTLHELQFEKTKHYLLNKMHDENYPKRMKLFLFHGPILRNKMFENFVYSYQINPDPSDQEPTNMRKIPFLSSEKSNIFLHRAIQEDKPVVIEYLLGNGLSLKNSSILAHYAASNNSDNVLQFLISAGVDINAKDNNGKTPLHHAASNGSEKTMELSIAAGADINAKDNNGRTPLHFTALNNLDKAMQRLIAARADINAKDNRGWTPIHYSARYNSDKAMQCLIAAKADINAKDEDDWTPLHYAGLYDSKNTIELLISSRADINAKDNNDKTPLDKTPPKSTTYKILHNAGARKSNKRNYSSIM